MGILRFLLAISVVFQHTGSIFGFGLVGGIMAVKAFYIISGFYMSLILNEKYVGVNGSYRLFISNRLLRLYPLYWTVLILTIAYSFFLAIQSRGAYWGNFNCYIQYFHSMSFTSLFFLIFTNLFLIFQDLVMFLGLDTSNGHLFFTSNFWRSEPQLFNFLFLPQAWTIGVEIAFYTIAPFLVRRKIKFIVSLIVLSLVLRLVLYHYGLKGDPWAYRFFPIELLFFLLGVLSYRLYVYIRDRNIHSRRLMLILIFMISFTLLYDQLPIHGLYYMYFFCFSVSLPFIFLLTKRWKYDTQIGELSYPIYISHVLILTIMKNSNLENFGIFGLNVALLSVLLSLLLNKFVAKRIEGLRQKRIR